MRRTVLTPLAAVARGAVAGAAGTAAMDLVWYTRFKKSGGEGDFIDFETTPGQDDWEGAPVPAELARRVGEGFLQKEISPQKAGLLNTLVHWSYGSCWGALYGLTVASTDKARASYGLILGPVVWGAAYVLLPPAKLYEPIWKYDLKTLAKDLSAHLAYGAGTGVAFRALTATRRNPKSADNELANHLKQKSPDEYFAAKLPRIKMLSRYRDHQQLNQKVLRAKDQLLALGK